jgi:hypothetical protein
MNTSFYCENLKVRDHLGELDVNGWIILKWLIVKYSGNEENALD